MIERFLCTIAFLVAAWFTPLGLVTAQTAETGGADKVSDASADEGNVFSSSAPSTLAGDVIPRDVREITERGLQYLLNSQQADGSWADSHRGPGTTAMGLLAFLASGEDPNFGIYSTAVRKALRNIIQSQDSSTGYMGPSLYHHGFAMLALAEAYGAVDETDLWADNSLPRNKQRSIGSALELAVRCAITSQDRNPFSGWRYSPSGRDADTSVSGAVLVGLLAARNAGIEVPDKSMEKAIEYFTSMTSADGSVAYTGGIGGGMGDSTARSSITCLVLSIAKRKDLKQFEATKNYVSKDMRGSGMYAEYTRYYQAQALFQTDLKAWDKWNRSLARQLKSAQAADGSINGQIGTSLSTSMGLLALALNYKFLPIYER